MSESASKGLSGLSEVLQEKAEKELGEKVKWRDRDVEALRGLVKARLDLYCPHDDDGFLLMFLRARKFDYEAAFKLILRYYEVRSTDYKSFFEHYRPSYVKDMYENGIVTKLPKATEMDPLPLLVRPGKWNPATVPLEDLLKANVMQIEKLIRIEENQVNGFILLMDLSDVSWNHAKNMNPMLAKKVLSIIQHAMPCRLKGIHYIAVPHFFEYLFSIIRPFLSEKLQKRIHIHSSTETLQEHFSVDFIPDFLGGNLDIEPAIKEWADELATSEDEFKSREKFGMKEVTTLSGDDPQTADPVGGITGTFRKLNCD